MLPNVICSIKGKSSGVLNLLMKLEYDVRVKGEYVAWRVIVGGLWDPRFRLDYTYFVSAKKKTEYS